MAGAVGEGVQSQRILGFLDLGHNQMIKRETMPLGGWLAPALHMLKRQSQAKMERTRHSRVSVSSEAQKGQNSLNIKSEVVY